MDNKDICNSYIRAMIERTKNKQVNPQDYKNEIDYVNTLCPHLSGVAHVYNRHLRLKSRILLKFQYVRDREEIKKLENLYINANRKYDKSYFKKDLTLKEKIKYYIGL